MTNLSRIAVSQSRRCFSHVYPLPICTWKGAAIVLALPVAGGLQAPAQAVSFRFDFGRDVSSEFRSAAREAGNAWSSVLKDNTVVELRIESQDLSGIGGNVLAGAQPGRVTVSYNQYVNALFQDAVSSDDFAGLNHLQFSADDRESLQYFQQGNRRSSQISLNSTEFKFVTDEEFVSGNAPNAAAYSHSSIDNYDSSSSGYAVALSTSGYDDDYSYDNDGSYYYQRSSRQGYQTYIRGGANGYGGSSQARNNEQLSLYYDDNGSNNNKKISLTRAQAKALGIEKQQTRGLDAIIRLNSSVDWDANSQDGVDSDSYDLSSVLQHEIGHALGIVSSVDALDFLSTSNQAASADDTPFSYVTPMDFYRYSSESASLGVMDLTLGGEKYFSLDGGRSAVRDRSGREAYFSTGSTAVGGDGYQGSHWRDTYDSLGVMDPSLRKGQSNRISSLDLSLLDVVGWDLEDSSKKRADAIGVNFLGYKRWLSNERQESVKSVVSEWESRIPELEAALDDALFEADLAFQTKLQDEFDELTRKLLDEGENYDSNYRSQEIYRFYRSTTQASNDRKNAIRDSANRIYATDQNVRQWLLLSAEGLSSRLESASSIEINRLSNIVKEAPWEEREALEQKLEVAIAPFVDRPNQLVEDLLDTSGPTNPIGFGPQKWWLWFQRGEDGAIDVEGASPVTYYSNLSYLTASTDEAVDTTSAIANNAGASNTLSQLSVVAGGDSGIVMSGLEPVSAAALSLTPLDVSLKASAQAAQDIPEPSSILALFGIAVLGNKLRKKENVGSY